MTEESQRSWEETQKAWEEVGERFSEMGRRISEHYRRLGQEAGAAADAERQGVRDAFQGLVKEVNQALTSVGEAVRDPRSKETLDRAVRSFGNALATTVSDLSSEIRQQVGSKPPPSDPGTGSPEAT